MNELLYLLLGWLLGLLGPRLVDSIKAHYDRKALAVAIKSEAEDLQYRLASASFLIARRDGGVTKEYLAWIKPKLEAYSGNEPSEPVRKLIGMLLEVPEEQRLALVEKMRPEPGVGLSLKNYSASLIESSLASMHSFPAEYQRCIHEFRNHLSILNQEVDRANESSRMSYDSSLTAENHDRLMADLNYKYKVIDGMCRRVCDRLQTLIEYDIKKI
jgi:hypothetical protein